MLIQTYLYSFDLYYTVRIVGGKKTPSFLAGRVEMMSGNQSYWVSVCADKFGQKEADIACREMGFSSSQILAPGSFASSMMYLVEVTCIGTEKSLRDCKSSSQGVCVSPSYNHASILCTKADTDPGK